MRSLSDKTNSLSLYENTRQFAFFPAFSDDSDWLIPVTSCDVCLSASGSKKFSFG